MIRAKRMKVVLLTTNQTQFCKCIEGNWRPGGPSYLDTQTFEDLEISVLFNRLNKMCTVKQLFNSVFS